MNKATLHLVALDSKIKINKFGKGGNKKKLLFVHSDPSWHFLLSPY